MIDHSDAPSQCIAVKPPVTVCLCHWCCSSAGQGTCYDEAFCSRHERKDEQDVVFAERTTFEEF
jgi:hypothetical protein